MKGFLSITMRRPLLGLLVPYGLGIALSDRIQLPAVMLWFALAILAGIGLMFLQNLRYKGLYGTVFVLFLFVFGWLRGVILVPEVSPLEGSYDIPATYIAQISGLPQREAERDIYAVKLKETADWKLRGTPVKVRLTVYDGSGRVRPRLWPGDWVEMEGILLQPPGRLNPKGFDYRRHLAGRGIHGTLALASPQITLLRPGVPLVPARLADAFRLRAGSVLDLAGAREGAVLRAMLLGERHLVPQTVRSGLGQAGLSHLLAISGLHVGFLVLLLDRLTRWLRLAGRPSFLLRAVVLLLYGGLAGFTPSVGRAVLMALLYLGARQLGRRSDLLNSLAAAAWVLLLLQPVQLFSIGFQLSFAGVMGIALISPRLRPHLAFLPGPAAGMAALTLGAQAGTLPLAAYHLNEFAPSGLLLNFLGVPLAGMVVLCGFILMLLGVLLPAAAPYFMALLRFPTGWLLALGELPAWVLPAAVRVVSPALGTLVVYYMILWIISKERPDFVGRPSRWIAVLLTLWLAARLVLPLLTPPALRVVFLDVGQGDCIHIQTPDGFHILVDGGGRPLHTEYGRDPGEAVVLPYLLKHGTARLHLVMMSHVHGDHIGGLVPVVQHLQVDAFMEYPPQVVNRYYQAIESALYARSIPRIAAYAGQTYRIGQEVLLHILYPMKEPRLAQALARGSENERSLVVLLEYREATVLLTGDIEGRAEGWLAPRLSGPADILKVPHHGSATSSSVDFIHAVDPIAAVIQVGRNRYGLPSPEVTARYEAAGIALYRNDQHGAVICTYRRGRWHIRTMR